MSQSAKLSCTCLQSRLYIGAVSYVPHSAGQLFHQDYFKAYTTGHNCCLASFLYIPQELDGDNAIYSFLWETGRTKALVSQPGLVWEGKLKST